MVQTFGLDRSDIGNLGGHSTYLGTLIPCIPFLRKKHLQPLGRLSPHFEPRSPAIFPGPLSSFLLITVIRW